MLLQNKRSPSATSKSRIDDDRMLTTFMSELQVTARAMAAR
jgi:hypothetical protein